MEGAPTSMILTASDDMMIELCESRVIMISPANPNPSMYSFDELHVINPAYAQHMHTVDYPAYEIRRVTSPFSFSLMVDSAWCHHLYRLAVVVVVLKVRPKVRFLLPRGTRPPNTLLIFVT